MVWQLLKVCAALGGVISRIQSFCARLSESGRPCRLSTNRHQRGRGRAVPLEIKKKKHNCRWAWEDASRPHTHTRTHTHAHKRFAEVVIYRMLCSMIKNNCSAAVCAQWCKVTWYCPTALFCISWTGPCRRSTNTCQVRHTPSHRMSKGPKINTLIFKSKWGFYSWKSLCLQCFCCHPPTY